jgi:type IV pilus assembly protein PilY1
MKANRLKIIDFFLAQEMQYKKWLIKMCKGDFMGKALKNKKMSFKSRYFFFAFILFSILFLPSLPYAAVMEDYCTIPPFILSGGVNPNLLLTIDNSGSMYDLAYIDDGKEDGGVFTRDPSYCYDQTFKNNVCSATRTTSCTVDADCPAGETCGENFYAGYFDDKRCSVTSSTLCQVDSDCPQAETCSDEVTYVYRGRCSVAGNPCVSDFQCLGAGEACIDQGFVPSPPGISFNDIVTGLGAVCTKLIPDTLCVDIVKPAPDEKYATAFIAKGNYLNWLVSSKFDVEKEILTGGKYDTVENELIAESRGCVGRRFVKEALTADFVNYDEVAGPPVGANIPLGLTFGVRGPQHSFNPTAPSPGGQSFIDIYDGDFDESSCQDAIDAFEEGRDPASIRIAVEDCLSYVPSGGKCEFELDMLGNPKPCSKNSDCRSVPGEKCLGAVETIETKRKVTFIQSIQACWQYLLWVDGEGGRDIGPDEVLTVKNQCPDIYPGGTCSSTIGGTNLGCNVDADCPAAGDTCVKGPLGIAGGNPGLLCGASYAGFCYNGGPPAWNSNWTSDECIADMHRKYCKSIELPPVIDPTDDPSTTTEFGNLPAIIGDIGVESQLGTPVATLNVRVGKATEPTGLLQEFEDTISFGAMSFNFNGSETECLVDTTVECPKVCSGHINITCTADNDCPDFPLGETCNDTALIAGADNRDGAKIIHYIGGVGKCSVNTGTACEEDSECPDFATGETCNMVGDHERGTCSITPTSCSSDAECPVGETCNTTLINRIDGIRADSWTPFSEGFYNAIGYYARTNAHTNPPALGTSRTDIRLDAGDYVDNKNPSLYRCQSNNILLISDGISTADQNAQVQLDVDMYNDGDGQIGFDGLNSCPKFAGSRNLDDLAWIGQNREITDFSVAVTPSTDLYKKITTHAVYNGAASADPGECNPDTLLSETADNGGGTYQRAENPEDLEDALRTIFTELSAKAASGTAASVLASGADKGANILQAVFYPRRKIFGDTEINWTGTLQSLWYYIDPLFGRSAIREDTDENRILHLQNDYIVQYYFDADAKKTKVIRTWDEEGDGDPLTFIDDIDFEGLQNLWEAGGMLWERDLSTNPRTIKTVVDIAGIPTVTDFSTDLVNLSLIQPYLQAADLGEAEAIVRYIHGEDTKCSITTTQACSIDDECPAGETCGGFNPPIAGFTDAYRLRTSGIDFNNDGDIVDAGEGPKVWKLGDIVNSTPVIVTWVPLNIYDTDYHDDTYKQFITSADYRNRGMVFTGANDGMLHAFKLGLLEVDWSTKGGFEHARLINPDTGLVCDPSTDANPCGKEEWAFIPKNVLPYLKYNADRGYCHLYSVDGTSVVFDASIGANANVVRASDGSSWKTVLIGSMKTGGACRASDDATCTDCVKAPGVDLDNPPDGVTTAEEKKLGFSSYFAIDVTDPANPQFLWEFTHDDLGFATTGPSIVRINKPDAGGANERSTNGEWFVVLASGPTGPIDTTTHQFMGRSDQNLKIFVLDLRDGTLKASFDTFNGSTITNAFGGTMFYATTDPDRNYADDGVYIAYTNSATGVGNTFTDGGVIRLLTKESDDPTTWAASKVIEGTGANTTTVARLINRITGKLWLFFGSGRYFFKSTTSLDDAVTQRKIYGLKDPCFSSGAFDTTCTTTVSTASLLDVTLDPDAAEDNEGWFVSLDAQGVPDVFFDAERIITDPLGSVTGVAFFTSFKPSSDICGFGGRSHLWAVRYNTGGSAAGLLRGRALLQVSTGSIEEISMEDAFKENDPGSPGYDPTKRDNPDSKGDRRTGAIAGKPPEGPGLILLTSPDPYQKTIQTMER